MKILLLALSLCATSAFAQLLPQAVGFYSGGSLQNASLLPLEGEGFRQLFVQQERAWATDDLLIMIKETAAHMARLYPDGERLVVEDLSAETGGKIEGHGSHQNGLDGDLQFFRADRLESHPYMTGKTYADPMVVNGRISPNFDLERNWELLKALHTYGNVQRIFVDQVIKNALCEYAKGRGEYQSGAQVLRSLRHVTNHQDHLHVRIRCPRTSQQCRGQGDLPAGTGCP